MRGSESLASGFESICPREGGEFLEYPECAEEYSEDASPAAGLPANPAEDSSPDEALEYLAQRQPVLRVRGLDALCSSPAAPEVLSDPAAEALVQRTAEEILVRSDAAGLVRAVSDDLAGLWPRLDTDAVGRLSRPVFAAFVTQLETAHALAYPEALCVNVLALAACARAAAGRLLGAPESAYQRQEELDGLAGDVRTILGVAIQLCG